MGNNEQTLSKQQRAILYLLYRFRFLNTNHLQQLLNHKYPSRIQAWMKDLTDKEYVHQFYERNSFIENTKPAVYCLASKARSTLKENKDCDSRVLKRLYREKNLSKGFQEHCLALADYAIQLNKQSEHTNATVYYFTQTELIGYNHFPQPLPDGYFAIKQKGKKIQRFFIDLFDEGTPRFALRQKIRRYITCVEDADWEKQTHTEFPTVILLCPTNQMQKYVQRFTKNVLLETYEEVSFEVNKYITS